ncbi:MAG: aminotransferase class V-fold PLP-dependent enzyme [Pilosibacter sp.]
MRNITQTPFRGLYELSEEATECYEDARKTVADFLHASCPEEIVFTRNATESLNLAAYTLSEYLLKPGDEIIVSIMEHRSNILPWQQAAKRYGATVKYLECDMDGTIPAERLESMITDHTKIAAITQISNVLGCRNDLKTFAEICHRHGVILVGDGAQSVPHIAVDVQDLGVDFLLLRSQDAGSNGNRRSYGKKELLEKLPPFLTGGEMIESVTREGAVWAEVPHKIRGGNRQCRRRLRAG